MGSPEFLCAGDTNAPREEHSGCEREGSFQMHARVLLSLTCFNPLLSDMGFETFMCAPSLLRKDLVDVALLVGVEKVDDHVVGVDERVFVVAVDVAVACLDIDVVRRVVHFVEIVGRRG